MSEQSKEVALVTGGAVRVGAAITRALAAEGFAVAINYHRSAAPAERLVDSLREEGRRAAALEADVTADGAAESLLDRTLSEFGRLDFLVNNAAVFGRRPFLELTPEDWSAHLRLNLEAPFRLGLAAARHMSERGSGRIVNICGTVGIQPLGEYTPYCVAKSGLDMLTRCMAEALAPVVQVNGVAPGAILFPEGTSEEEKKRVLARVPAGHVGDPDDVARVVAFLARAPAYVTGTILPVDGGAALVTG